MKDICAVFAPLHKVWLAGIFAVGIGFTVMVKLEDEPVQVMPLLRYCGVTLIVAMTGVELLALVAVNEAMFPVPEFTKPMEGVVFVQS